ncbi:c-type cytochrome biogenesis protein CcsB [Galbitalea soli]|uniref:C-type cytochrome biogenesis protein CcsB n=2 Tax=Galbitalea soli TaxID=1268042 RepID=A0A7C9PMX2_9MICO|nr:c-type cytochrome biogenesis protein CcsB [Galbitalea soli]NEM91008.1 c-type cytochrome biogenesis protein CcsB [Galbitalea soli]
MVVYAFAFIAFTLDLARRASTRRVEVSVAAPVTVAATTATAGSTAVLDRPDSAAPVTPGPEVPARSRAARLGMSFTIIAWVLHVGGTVLRGVAAGRVPWANMFEFSLTATAIIVGVFLVVQLWQDLRFLGAYVAGFVLIFLGIATTNFYVDVVPLPPALQSGWLVIHVFVASLGTGFYGLGAALSVVQLVQQRRMAKGLRFIASVPDPDRLETMAYRLIVVGFVFWTFTLMAGAIWAEHAWGRYWGWDTKEVWTFIIWTIYAGYIHARATRGWRGSRSATLALIGFGAVLFNFTIVNLFFKGLHSYSGL